MPRSPLTPARRDLAADWSAPLPLPLLPDVPAGPTTTPRSQRGTDPSLRALGQYPTPIWVAEALVAERFGDLDASDVVLEPTCGRYGGFLRGVPAHVPAYGVEFDPAAAALAREATGRTILTGDIRTIDLALRPTAIIGNPPFAMDLVDALLDRAYALLPEGGRCGLLLPTSAFQTAKRVAGYAERWSLAQDMLPRNIYPNLKSPLCFAVFSKDRRRTLVGFALYRQAAAIQDFDARYREILEIGVGTTATSGSVWRTAVGTALAALGGEASIHAIYAAMEGRRPTSNRFWREQVRKVLQAHFVRIEKGRYALPDAPQRAGQVRHVA